MGDSAGRGHETDRRRFFADATEALTSSLDYNETLQRVADLAVPLLADALAIHLPDERGELQLVAAAHVDPDRTPAMTILASGGARAHESRGWVRSIRESRPILFAEITPEIVIDTLREHPDLVAAYASVRFTSQISVPLVTRGRTLGGITLALGPGDRRYTQTDVSELQDLARVIAVAVDNALLFRDAERRQADADAARDRASFLSQVGAVLSSSLELESTIARATRLAVPTLADFCDLRIRDNDGELRPLSCAHVDPEKERLMVDVSRRYRLDLRQARMTAAALAANESMLVPQVDWRALARDATVDNYALRALQLLDPTSAVVVPLSVHGRAIGTISLFMSESGRVFSQADLPVLEEFARRVASAVENARLYESTLESNRLKDEFLSVLSHELRTPLNAVLGWSRMLVAGQLDDAARQKAADSIHRNANAQLRLVEDILDVARGLAGKLQVSLEPTEIEEAVDAAVATAASVASARSIEVVRTRGARSLIVAADPVRLRQILDNLLSNALKFTEAGGRIEVQVGRGDGVAEIVVRDTGIGIDGRFLPHVFERFRQADASVTRGYGGLGLGLAIVKQLVDLHHGTVSAESDGHGAGSTFTVRLPLWKGEMEESGGEPVTFGTDTVALHGLSVLLVDDNPDALEIVGTILRTRGALVDARPSAGSAYDRLAERRFDLLLVDLAMPGEDGCSLVARIRRRRDPLSRVPAIALSAYVDDVMRARAAEAGFDAHIEKPVDPDRLVHAIVALLGAARR